MFSILYSIVAYLIGAIPTGFLVARLAGISDITQHGSGNIGATNVARVAGKKYFLVVFLLDVAKAWLYLMLLHYYGVHDLIQYAAAATLLIGNSFSLFLGGKGGKGVATAVGIMAACNVKIVVAMLIFWLVFFIKTRTVGISSVITLLLLPILVFASYPVVTDFFLLCVFISCWGIWRHASNIKQFFATLRPAA